MPTSTRFAVAIHVLTNVAVGDGSPVRSEDLASSAGTSPVVIRALISRLNEAGLTRTQLGAGGGVQLAMPAERIRLLDIYKATEKTALFSMHRNAPDRNCQVGSVILEAIFPALDRARSALETELAGVTLDDIANEVGRRGKFTLPLER